MGDMGCYSITRYQTPGRVWAEAVDIPVLVRVTSETWSEPNLLTETW